MTSISWINDQSVFAGVPIMRLVEAYQTPLFVYDQEHIENNINEVKACFVSDENTSIYYASKAFLTLAMAKIICDQKIGIDVASRGELYIALKGGIDSSKILYHGNNKSKEDILFALHHGVKKFVIDSIAELLLMKDILNVTKDQIHILIRIIPNLVGIETHKNITTGHKSSKFGIQMDHSLDQVMDIILSSSFIKFDGFHFHVGSQLMSNQYHLQAIDHTFTYIKALKETYHIIVSELNIGGGFGIPYVASDRPKPIREFLMPLIKKIDHLSQQIGIPRPHISIEPGRYIVGGTAIILYSVGTIKDAKPYPFIAINGGMTENLRVALYNAHYEVMIVNRKAVCDTHYTIVGNACESTDVMIEDAWLPKVKTGDTLAFLNAGAYEHSIINNFNKTLKPAVVMIHQGMDRIIQQREELEDLIKRDAL